MAAPTRREIDEMIEKAEHVIAGDKEIIFADAYASGVKAALMWVLEEGEEPV